MKLFLKGDRCYTDKCAIERRNYPPGQHGQSRPRFSNFGIQLREKQKVKRIYGLLERQFRKTVGEAERMRGITGENLLALLERRLDNTVCRLGFVTSRSEARQLVRHGHFTVNGRRMDIPSYLVKEGDTVEWKAVKDSVPDFIQTLTDGLPKRPVPIWLRLDAANLKGEVASMPGSSDIETGIDSRLIVEFYSK